MGFNTLNLNDQLVKAIAEMGYQSPTKIQEQAIPIVMAGNDLRASAQTGTGKTAAFLLPLIDKISKNKDSKQIKALILAPTRELAMQISEEAFKYTKHLPWIKTVCLCGGIPFQVQTKNLRRPFSILVATPGRLIDAIERKKLDLSAVEALVLDEADRMLDMGFVEPVEQIIACLPKKKQTLLFTATLKGAVLKLSERLLNNPEEIIVHAEGTKHDNIEQRIHYVDDLSHKNRLLDHLLEDKTINSAIIFTSTKRHADLLTRELNDKGHSVAGLHGDMTQRMRTRTLAQLKKGNINILVATDVASRGIDVDSLTHVFNFDLPRDIENYVHRVGRTGRAGNKGSAVSFAGRGEASLVKQIEAFTKNPIEVVEIPGFEPKMKQQTNNFSDRKQKKWTPRRPQQRPPQSKSGRGGNGRTSGSGTRSKSFSR